MADLPRLVLLLATTTLLVTAGCVGVLTGSEPLSVEGEPVSVAPSALDEAGYEEVRVTEETLTEEVSAAGQTREVRVTMPLAEYSRTVSVEGADAGELARFVVVSSPAVEVLGKTLNPIGEMSPRELLGLVQDSYDGLGDIQPAGERSMTVLGTSATVSTFTGEATVEGTDQSIELTFHVLRVRDGNDFVLAMAIHPTVLDGEADRVDTMLGGVLHG